jgi:hypothetical protein
VAFSSGIWAEIFWAEIFWEEGYLGWRKDNDYEDAI